MSSTQISSDESPRTMRPVAILFFTAVLSVAALLAATASFAVSPLAPRQADVSGQ
ncbi:hypothetical protein [Rhizobium sp. C4]|uniref:hypothetical protein n=1 Tax=Rhizobium sp. C4 TaxID=1349800 RepID=UPI001E282B77|nr:hypothetical protein [Rhizobium sp. C4]MCD2173692.1 hypothetical protein [Rhizobium sp. C4]